MRQFKFSDKFIFPISSIKKREFFKLIKKNKTILDYGCGNGVWDNYNSNKKIYLYDNNYIQIYENNWNFDKTELIIYSYEILKLTTLDDKKQ